MASCEFAQPVSSPSSDVALSLWPVNRVRDLRDAILCAVIYGDLFDYPLTAQQIHRYLPCYDVPLAAVEQQLLDDSRLGELLDSDPPFWFLAGRAQLVEVRRQRSAFSSHLWRAAQRYGRLIAALPFVRMVAVTGALAMENAACATDDIDLLIATAKGRVWLVRGQAVLLVRAVRQLGVELCPNYVMAEDRLSLAPRSFFTAHELAQLIPLYGCDLYCRILEANAWIWHYLPNAIPNGARGTELGPLLRWGKKASEAVLGGDLGDAVERWEQQRKILRLTQQSALRGGAGALFAPDICKGHMDDHGAVILRRFEAALAAHGL